jgi:4-alpha-glucanotransferase
MNRWIDRRRSAILLHITSLPGPFHKGVLGKEAFQFIDALKSGGFTVWQFLPLGPTHGHGSPYESLSTFAGNPELIDLRDCVASGWLDDAILKGELSKQTHAKYRNLASHAFWAEQENNVALKKEVLNFQQKHAYWLEDFSLFSALKFATNDQAWWQWGSALRNRDPEALNTAKDQHKDLVQQIIFEQFILIDNGTASKIMLKSKVSNCLVTCLFMSRMTLLMCGQTKLSLPSMNKAYVMKWQVYLLIISLKQASAGATRYTAGRPCNKKVLAGG